MSQILKLLAALVLLVVAALCLFGIMATSDPRGGVAVRVMYTSVGLVALIAAIGLIFSSLGGGGDGGPTEGEPRQPDDPGRG